MEKLHLLTRVTIVGLGLVAGGCQKHEEKEEKVVTEVAVETGKITRATLHAFIEVFGTVEPEPASDTKPAASVRVASAVAGLVIEARAIEGQRVEKGALLFSLDDRLARAAVEKARQSVERAQAAEKFAGVTLEREQMLFKQENTSQKKLQEAEQLFTLARAESAAARAELATMETQLKLFHVAAPLAGTVLRVNVKPGENVELTTSLAEVADLSRLVVSANVPSAEAGGLKLGLPVELPGAKPVKAALTFVSPQVDAKTDAVLVRATIAAGAGLRPGQFLRVRIVSAERPACLTVPRASVYTDSEGQSVLSVVEGGVAKQKVIKVGLREGELVEVSGEGLVEGATVVTTGAYALPKETKVRIIEPAGKEAVK